MQALIGALSTQGNSPNGAQSFVHAHILSRSIDPKPYLNMSNARHLVATLFHSKKMERPTMRLLKETGRLSATPTFVVGCYAGLEKIGEGYGSSLKMAELRVCISVFFLFLLSLILHCLLLQFLTALLLNFIIISIRIYSVL